MTDIIIPEHVQTFLTSRSPSLSKAFNTILNIHDEVDFELLDVQLEGAEQSLRIARGFLFKTYRNQHLDTRDFSAFLEKRGVARSTAYDYMDEASVFEKLHDEGQCETLARLGAQKIRALKSLNEDEFNSFVDGDEVRGISIITQEQFSTTDFVRTIRNKEPKKQELVDLRERLNTEETKVKDLQKRLQKRSTSSDYPEFVDVTRHESVVLADYIGIRLDDLERLGTELLNIISTTDNTPEFKTFCDIAGASLFTNVRMIEARSARLLTLLSEALPKSATTGTDISQIMLIGEEVEQAIRDRADMVQDHEREKFERENARQMRKPRKAGRPKAQK